MSNAQGSDLRKFFSVSDVKFQTEFVGLMVFVTLSSVLVMLAGTYFMIERFATLAAQIPGVSGGFESEVHAQTQQIWWMMLGAALVNCGCNAIFAFWFSKRLSGIVYRVTKDLNRLMDGEPVNKIVPREGDFFIPMVNAVNRVIETKQRP
jgi:hypothetical protein